MSHGLPFCCKWRWLRYPLETVLDVGSSVSRTISGLAVAVGMRRSRPGRKCPRHSNIRCSGHPLQYPFVIDVVMDVLRQKRSCCFGGGVYVLCGSRIVIFRVRAVVCFGRATIIRLVVIDASLGAAFLVVAVAVTVIHPLCWISMASRAGVLHRRSCAGS